MILLLLIPEHARDAAAATRPATARNLRLFTSICSAYEVYEMGTFPFFLMENRNVPIFSG